MDGPFEEVVDDDEPGELGLGRGGVEGAVREIRGRIVALGRGRVGGVVGGWEGRLWVHGGGGWDGGREWSGEGWEEGGVGGGGMWWLALSGGHGQGTALVAQMYYRLRLMQAQRIGRGLTNGFGAGFAVGGRCAREERTEHEFEARILKSRRVLKTIARTPRLADRMSCPTSAHMN